MRIDCHHHFWRYDPIAYDWIDAPMAAIRRDYLPAYLAAAIAAAGVDGVVSVQARQSLEETAWLLELAANHPFVLGVVGWVPLVAPDLGEILDRLTDNPLLRGVRHVVQGEPDPDFLRRPDFNAGVARLHRHGLTYDLLIVERQLPAAIEFVDRHPEQSFILDHAAKPRIREGGIDSWRVQIRELARRPQVFCKLSGLVTEADWHTWTPDDLRPYVEVLLESFGPRRLMFGSDWPVCLVAADYGQWLRTVHGWIAALTADEQESILGGTAQRVYGLQPLEARPTHG